MNKNDLLTILYDWNFWEKAPNTGIYRLSYVSKIIDGLKGRQVIFVTGVRRCGKSFILRQTAETLIKNGVSPNNILIVNFEDPRFIKRDAALLEEIFKVYKNSLKPEGQMYILLDEIQEINGWERWVRMVHELDKAKILLSGSNSELLSGDFSTVLTGRHINIIIYPLSFVEFKDFYKSPERDLLQKYFEIGGFPDVVLRTGDREVLLSYFEDIFEHDLVKRHNVRKTEPLKSLCQYLMSNPSSVTSFTSMKNNLNVSINTVMKFSDFIEDAFFGFFVKRFSFKFKEQEKNPRKAYIVDSGLANAIGFFNSPGTGYFAENCVYLELLRRGYGKKNIFYFKDEKHREVDFIVQKNQGYEAIQVCWDLNRAQTKERELKGLLIGMEKLKLDTGLVLTASGEEEIKIDKKLIKIKSLESWLVGD